ncbi:Metallo-dependent phosphatase-like protein [Helicostylum pulchrum]|nr:Metallo-dependent phosphatase-like protein [Helicostylum pulchrum]
MIMKYAFILSLVSIATVALARDQQSTFSLPELQIQNELNQLTDDLLQVESITTSCSSCISLLHLVKKMSYMSESFLINTLTRVCKRTNKVDNEVCEGVIREQAPIIRKVLPSMTVSGRDGHLMCAAILNSCPYPDIEHWNVPFPKPKPDILPTLSKSRGKTMTVLQLSDWHIDPDYIPGSEVICDKPICCRPAYTDYTNITKQASIWGEYSCDTPLTLIQSLLDYIPKVEPDITFGIMTGDVPPHEVWSTLPILKTQLIQDETYRLLHQHFDSPYSLDSMLYPAVGNHEAAPSNNFPLKSSNIPIEIEKDYLDLKWLYKSLAHSWRGWLSLKTNPQVERNTGSYTARPVRGLKLISLNTNFCYILNWWLYEHPIQKDPNGVLTWLIGELQDSEDRAERVWIIGHIAPGDSTCFHDYANYYNQIIDRYSHIISGQFFGHTHKDEMTIFYGHNKNQTAKEAISVGYVAPSITPFHNLNPGFRVYKIDTETFEVVDSITYTADLDQASTWLNGPNWHVEYSAREEFNSTLAYLPSPSSSLSAAWWHNVTIDMETNQETFNKYRLFTTKSSPLTKECDDNCKKNTICNIRAGKSEQRCDYESDVFNGEGIGIKRETYKPETHLCAMNLVGVRSQQ